MKVHVKVGFVGFAGTALMLAVAVPAVGASAEGDGNSISVINSLEDSQRPGPTIGGGESDGLSVRSVPPCSSGVGRCLWEQLSCTPNEQVVAQYRGVATLPGPPGPGWAYIGQVCSDGQGGQGVLSLNDFQRLELPATGFTIQPPGGDVLINMPTNVVAHTDPVVLWTTTLGQQVEVVATPSAWTIDFGDGVVIGPTNHPGAPYPDLTNSHAYTQTGVYQVRVTTTYAGRYRVDDGSWRDVEGTASVTGPGVTLTAHTAQAHLVGE